MSNCRRGASRSRICSRPSSNRCSQAGAVSLAAAGRARAAADTASDDHADPHADKLQRILVHYHEWLKTLTPTQARAGRSAGRRAREGGQADSKAATRRAGADAPRRRADADDMCTILRWTEDFVWKNRERVLANMSEQQQELQSSDVGQQRQRTAHGLSRSRSSGVAGRGRMAYCR